MALAEYSIGALTLRPGHELRDGAAGRPVAIGSRTLELLATLAEADGAVLTKDELFSGVWGTPIVEENTLHAQISAARKALGGELFGKKRAAAGGARHAVDPSAVHPGQPARLSSKLTALPGKGGPSA